MTTIYRYRTNTLLTALAALTLTTPSFAGFNETSPGSNSYTYDASNTSPLTLTTDVTTLDILSLMSSGDAPASFTDTIWLNNTSEDTEQPYVVNFSGHTYLNFEYNDLAQVGVKFNTPVLSNYLPNNKIEFYPDVQINLNNADSSLNFDFSHYKSAAIKNRGILSFNNLAGDIVVTNSSDVKDSNDIVNHAVIEAGLVRMKAVAETSHISITTNSDDVNGIDANLLLISDFNGKISVTAGDPTTHSPFINNIRGIHARDMYLGGAGNTASINVNTSGSNVAGIHADRQVNLYNPSNFNNWPISEGLDFAGDINVTAGHDSDNVSNASGIQSESFRFYSITNDSHISVNASGSDVFGINTGTIVFYSDFEVSEKVVTTTTPYVVTPQFSGDITVNAGKNGNMESNAYGIKANHIRMAKVDSDSHISVTGTGRNVYGIYGESEVKIREYYFEDDPNHQLTGYAGDITVNADHDDDNISNAVGIYCHDADDFIIGSVASDSHISVTGTGSDVYGLYTLGTLEIIRDMDDNHYEVYIPSDGFSGDITVQAGHTIQSYDAYSNAYGIKADRLDMESFNADAHINVSGTGSNVFGIHASELNLYEEHEYYDQPPEEPTKVFAGDITVNAGHTRSQYPAHFNPRGTSDAYGIYSDDELRINVKSVSSDSHISVTGAGSNVYGIYADEGDGGITATDFFAGDITINAGNNYDNQSNAYGIHADLNTFKVASESHISVTATGSDVAAIKTGTFIVGHKSYSSIPDEKRTQEHLGYHGDITVSAGHNNEKQSNAYGIYADSFITLYSTHEDSTISVSGTGSDVTGIFAKHNVSIYRFFDQYTHQVTDGFDGDLIVTAGHNDDHESNAFGIHAQDGWLSVRQLTDTGSISVTGSGSNVHALYAPESSVTLNNSSHVTVSAGKNLDSISNASGITGDIFIGLLDEGSSISVTGTGSDVYGIKARYIHKQLGAFSYFAHRGGTINVEAGSNNLGESNAFGYYLDDGIEIDQTTADTNLIVSGTGSNIYGVKADEITTYSSYAGTITTSGASNVYGLYASDKININEASSDLHISVTSTNANAYGIKAGEESDNEDNIIIADIFAGDITVNAGKNSQGQSFAYGIHGDMDAHAFTSDSHISVTSTGSDIAGIYSNELEFDTHAISDETTQAGNIASGYYGDITIDAGQNDQEQSNAYGIYSNQSIQLGLISEDSEISVTSTGSDVFGIHANQHLGIEGSLESHLSGTITINAGSNSNNESNAYGLHTNSGQIYINKLSESGSINVTASGSNAHAIYNQYQNHYVSLNHSGNINVSAGHNADGSSNASAITAGSFEGSINAGSTIQVTGTGSDVYGINTKQATPTNLDNNGGSIIINAGSNNLNQSNTAAIQSTGSINYDTTNDNAFIQVTGTGSHVYGFNAEKNFSSNGQLSGSVLVSGLHNAYGIKSNYINIDNLDANISVTADHSLEADQNGDSHAYGMKGTGSIHFQSVSSDTHIQVTATGSRVYGIHTSSEDINSEISTLYGFAGDITVDAGKDFDGNSYAAGMYAEDAIYLNSVTSDSQINVTGYRYLRGIGSRYIQVDEGYAGQINIIGKNNGYSGSNSGIVGLDHIYINGFAEDAHINVQGNGNSQVGIYSKDLDIVDSFAGSINVQGDERIYGITAYDCEIENFSGSITASGSNYVYGLYVHDQPLDMRNITGTISATASQPNAIAAAITTQRYDTSINDWVETNENSDIVELKTDANIIGDIRLGNLGFDTLYLSGAGSFNDNLHGIDSVFIRSDPANSTNQNTWYLNLKNAPDINDHARNVTQRLIVTDGFLQTTNLATEILAVGNNGGLTFDLNNFQTIHASERASTFGTARFTNLDSIDFNEGDELTLIDSNLLINAFRTTENAIIDETLALAIYHDYELADVIARVTLIGDTNFDSVINDLDFTYIAENYLSSITYPTHEETPDFFSAWQLGDFNSDGTVNDDDLLLMTHNTGLTLTELQNKLIPEPTTLTLFSLAAIPFLRRRKHTA
ncbi:hypothetical protein JD969_05870 [Planctomycetota bacterium]|nr:hypothetical protein JD969_05870 [Planctomycetota bacterium]